MIQADTSCICVTGVPSFLTSAGMLVMFKSSMSSCQRLESCPSSIGSSWIPGLLQRQEGFKSKLRKSKQNIMTSCEFLKQEAGEMNKPFWYCILVWLLQLLTFTHTVKTLNHPLWLLGSGPNPSAMPCCLTEFEPLKWLNCKVYLVSNSVHYTTSVPHLKHTGDVACNWFQQFGINMLDYI